MYIIRNGKVGPEPEQIPRKLTDIASRSLSSLTKSVAMSDLYRVWTVAERNHIDFHYVGIPDDYEADPKEPFDPDEDPEGLHLDEAATAALRAGPRPPDKETGRP